MASQLTNVSNAVRQYGLTVIFSLVGLIIVWNLANAGFRAITKPKPTPTPPANVLFGQLEPLQFAEKPPLSVGLRFNLETIDGNVPTLATPSAIVYGIRKQTAGLDYAQRAEETARKASFINPQIAQTSENTLLFIDSEDQNRRMTYDFVYKNLEIKYENMNSYVSLEIGSAPPSQAVINRSKTSIVQLHPELEERLGKKLNELEMRSTFYYLEPTTNTLQEVATHTQGNITVLDAILPAIANYPVIGPSAEESLVRFVYTGVTSSSNRVPEIRLLASKMIWWPIETEPVRPASYPLKSPDTAWAELQQGNGYVLHPVTPNEEFNIRKIYMAYYTPDVPSQYLQPVWVFEGDKPTDSKFLFRAIIPAVAQPHSQLVQ